MDDKSENVKTAIEIGVLANRLTVTNQSYVLNTINALLFSQQANDTDATAAEQRVRQNNT